MKEFSLPCRACLEPVYLDSARFLELYRQGKKPLHARCRSMANYCNTRENDDEKSHKGNSGRSEKSDGTCGESGL